MSPSAKCVCQGRSHQTSLYRCEVSEPFTFFVRVWYCRTVNSTPPWKEWQVCWPLTHSVVTSHIFCSGSLSYKKTLPGSFPLRMDKVFKTDDPVSCDMCKLTCLLKSHSCAHPSGHLHINQASPDVSKRTTFYTVLPVMLRWASFSRDERLK